MNPERLNDRGDLWRSVSVDRLGADSLWGWPFVLLQMLFSTP